MFFGWLLLFVKVCVWVYIQHQFCLSSGNDLVRLGAEEACWAHNPKVVGSKPTAARAIPFCYAALFPTKYNTDATYIRARELLLYLIILYPPTQHPPPDTLRNTVDRYCTLTHLPTINLPLSYQIKTYPIMPLAITHIIDRYVQYST